MSNTPSRSAGRHGNEIQTSASAILNKLFPSRSHQFLAQLSRNELLQLANDGTLPINPPALTEEQGGPLNLDLDSDDEREWNEPQETQDPESAMCDDVNGLSLRLQHRSYMGVSSTHAILRTMIRLKPSIQTDLKYEATNNWGMTSPSALGHEATWDHNFSNLIPSINEQTSITEYFTQFHEVFPILDEADFRLQWERGDRSDRPWLALLNMVLVMGSLAAGNADDNSHEIYYMRARSYLDFGLLSTGCVESLQALCLLAGHYLHYRNSPNMGYAILGAAIRMAIALGLHREPTKQNEIPGSHWKPQTRRKIWWSLFCVDTYGSMTLGRTTLGRWDPETMNVKSLSDLDKRDTGVLFLDCARAFCMIATRVQHRFAEFRPITTSEINGYDSEVREWFQRLPDELRQQSPSLGGVHSAKYVMHSRYYNLRLLLFPPFLLNYANRKGLFDTLTLEEQNAIRNCRNIACEAIDQIVSMMHTLNKLRVWSAAWFLYQATIVALLSIIVEPDHAEAERWRGSIEKALMLFERMAPWSPAATRSKQVISRIYDTCAITSMAVTSNTLQDMVDVDFDMAVYDQLGLDMFREGWHWDMSNWSDNLGLYPEWTGE